jgi:ABC-type transporter Mla maintaining outer membrane lipid asymmetry ATPase subunit MlaF
VSLTLRPGEMICITGAAGSGKSVLLQLAIGFQRPDWGKVLVQDRDITGMSETQLLKLRSNLMGVVFQESSLFTSLSVYENAAYRLYEQGLSEEAAERETNDVLRFVGLQDDADKLPEELSIGMRRRLEFARALVGWPPIMLFDEPASGLDPINARNILDLVINARDLHRVSSLFVTKEPWEIKYLSNHLSIRDGDAAAIVQAHQAMPAVSVMVLDRGHVAFHGSYKDFESSDLPAVRLMTQALRQPEYSNKASANPWQTGTPRQFKLWPVAGRKHSR